MSCPNCERLRKEMEEMKESMQLREFELEEKLNHLEDKVEWVNEDKGNLKAELDDTLELVKKYKALLAKFGIEETTLEEASSEASSSLRKTSVPRLLEIIRTQTELMQEMRELIVGNTAPQ